MQNTSSIHKRPYKALRTFTSVHTEPSSHSQVRIQNTKYLQVRMQNTSDSQHANENKLAAEYYTKSNSETLEQCDQWTIVKLFNLNKLWITQNIK